MVFDISVALTWLLFLALFPITYFWLRRAWIVVVKRDFSEVALKRGAAAPTPVPTRFSEVADALGTHRGALEAGGVFPPMLLDRLVERLSE